MPCVQNNREYPREFTHRLGRCLYSTSASAELTQQRFLHRRLRGVHIPASRNACKLPNGDPNSLRDLFRSSLTGIQGAPPTVDSYAALLCYCSKAFAWTYGILVHDRIIEESLEENAILRNYIIQMYGHCGLLEDAYFLFASNSRRDEYSWNFLIRAYSQHQQSTDNIQLFEKMLGEGILPNKFIFTSILLGYSSPEILNQGRYMHVRIIGSMHGMWFPGML